MNCLVSRKDSADSAAATTRPRISRLRLDTRSPQSPQKGWVNTLTRAMAAKIAPICPEVKPMEV